MEHYSTGEAAHLCGITIRTVQYYDVCGLIRPSAQTSAGHRLYSEHDIKRMQFVCTLRSLGFSIADIKRIFHESEGETLIQLMLTEQIQQLHRDITHKETQIRALEELLSTLKSAHCFSISHLEDSMAILQNKKPLRRIRKNMFITAAVLEILERYIVSKHKTGCQSSRRLLSPAFLLYFWPNIITAIPHISAQTVTHNSNRNSGSFSGHSIHPIPENSPAPPVDKKGTVSKQLIPPAKHKPRNMHRLSSITIC